MIGGNVVRRSRATLRDILFAATVELFGDSSNGLSRTEDCRSLPDERGVAGDCGPCFLDDGGPPAHAVVGKGGRVRGSGVVHRDEVSGGIPLIGVGAVIYQIAIQIILVALSRDRGDRLSIIDCA